MSRHWHTALMIELASHGYLAVALSHKYSAWDPVPAGGFRPSPRWFDNCEDGPEEGLSLEEYLADDARHAMRRLSGLNAGDDNGHGRGRLDLNRIAFAAHSRGGTTVTEIGRREASIRACLNFDDNGSYRAQMEGLGVPILVLKSDEVKAWDAKRLQRLHRFQRFHRFQRLHRSAAYEVVLPGANHNTFSPTFSKA